MVPSAVMTEDQVKSRFKKMFQRRSGKKGELDEHKGQFQPLDKEEPTEQQEEIRSRLLKRSRINDESFETTEVAPRVKTSTDRVAAQSEQVKARQAKATNHDPTCSDSATTVALKRPHDKGGPVSNMYLANSPEGEPVKRSKPIITSNHMPAESGDVHRLQLQSRCVWQPDPDQNFDRRRLPFYYSPQSHHHQRPTKAMALPDHKSYLGTLGSMFNAPNLIHEDFRICYNQMSNFGVYSKDNTDSSHYNQSIPGRHLPELQESAAGHYRARMHNDPQNHGEKLFSWEKEEVTQTINGALPNAFKPPSSIVGENRLEIGHKLSGRTTEVQGNCLSTEQQVEEFWNQSAAKTNSLERAVNEKNPHEYTRAKSIQDTPSLPQCHQARIHNDPRNHGENLFSWEKDEVKQTTNGTLSNASKSASSVVGESRLEISNKLIGHTTDVQSNCPSTEQHVKEFWNQSASQTNSVERAVNEDNPYEYARAKSIQDTPSQPQCQMQDPHSHINGHQDRMEDMELSAKQHTSEEMLQGKLSNNTLTSESNTVLLNERQTDIVEKGPEKALPQDSDQHMYDEESVERKDSDNEPTTQRAQVEMESSVAEERLQFHQTQIQWTLIPKNPENCRLKTNNNAVEDDVKSLNELVPTDLVVEATKKDPESETEYMSGDESYPSWETGSNNSSRARSLFCISFGPSSGGSLVEYDSSSSSGETGTNSWLDKVETIQNYNKEYETKLIKSYHKNIPEHNEVQKTMKLAIMQTSFDPDSVEAVTKFQQRKMSTLNRSHISSVMVSLSKRFKHFALLQRPFERLTKRDQR